MRNEEDEAFDELAKRQGDWGGGFPAKRKMAADKLHWSDCAVHNAPAYPAGECDCDVTQEPVRKVLKLALEALETERDIYREHDEDGAPEYILDAITAIKEALAQPAQQEALYGMNQDDWKDVVAAITKVRDGRGIYLGCRPADVFQDWFLALGTAKVKEKNT
jgi:hypothetical protein